MSLTNKRFFTQREDGLGSIRLAALSCEKDHSKTKMTRREAEGRVLRSNGFFEGEHEESPACVRLGRTIWRALMQSLGTP